MVAVGGEKREPRREENEWLSARRIDNLTSVYASLVSIAEQGTGMRVIACLDSEEVGSLTRQGADSDFLSTVLTRIASAQGLDAQGYSLALSHSFCLSLDGAHGFHPNHPEQYDPRERAFLR